MHVAMYRSENRPVLLDEFEALLREFVRENRDAQEVLKASKILQSVQPKGTRGFLAEYNDFIRFLNELLGILEKNLHTARENQLRERVEFDCTPLFIFERSLTRCAELFQSKKPRLNPELIALNQLIIVLQEMLIIFDQKAVRGVNTFRYPEIERDELHVYLDRQKAAKSRFARQIADLEHGTERMRDIMMGMGMVEKWEIMKAKEKLTIQMYQDELIYYKAPISYADLSRRYESMHKTKMRPQQHLILMPPRRPSPSPVVQPQLLPGNDLNRGSPTSFFHSIPRIRTPITAQPLPSQPRVPMFQSLAVPPVVPPQTRSPVVVRILKGARPAFRRAPSNPNRLAGAQANPPPVEIAPVIEQQRTPEPEPNQSELQHTSPEPINETPETAQLSTNEPPVAENNESQSQSPPITSPPRALSLDSRPHSEDREATPLTAPIAYTDPMDRFEHGVRGIEESKEEPMETERIEADMKFAENENADAVQEQEDDGEEEEEVNETVSRVPAPITYPPRTLSSDSRPYSEDRDASPSPAPIAFSQHDVGGMEESKEEPMETEHLATDSYRKSVENYDYETVPEREEEEDVNESAAKSPVASTAPINPIEREVGGIDELREEAMETEQIEDDRARKSVESNYNDVVQEEDAPRIPAPITSPPRTLSSDSRPHSEERESTPPPAPFSSTAPVDLINKDGKRFDESREESMEKEHFEADSDRKSVESDIEEVDRKEEEKDEEEEEEDEEVHETSPESPIPIPEVVYPPVHEIPLPPDDLWAPESPSAEAPDHEDSLVESDLDTTVGSNNLSIESSGAEADCDSDYTEKSLETGVVARDIADSPEPVENEPPRAVSRRSSSPSHLTFNDSELGASHSDLTSPEPENERMEHEEPQAIERPREFSRSPEVIDEGNYENVDLFQEAKHFEESSERPEFESTSEAHNPVEQVSASPEFCFDNLVGFQGSEESQKRSPIPEWNNFVEETREFKDFKEFKSPSPQKSPEMLQYEPIERGQYSGNAKEKSPEVQEDYKEGAEFTPEYNPTFTRYQPSESVEAKYEDSVNYPLDFSNRAIPMEPVYIGGPIQNVPEASEPAAPIQQEDPEPTRFPIYDPEQPGTSTGTTRKRASTDADEMESPPKIARDGSWSSWKRSPSDDL